MRILIINFEYPPLGGGGGIATQGYAQELGSRHEIHVITSGSSFDTVRRDNAMIHHVRVIGRQSRQTSSLLSLICFIPCAIVSGMRLCKRISFDVINAQFVLPSGLVGVFLSTIYRIPFVVSFIGADLYDPSRSLSPHRHWYLRAMVRAIARRARVCTAISEDTRQRAQALHGVTQNIQVIPLGIRSFHAQPITRKELRVPDGAFLIVSIGRLIPRKGYDSLIDAVRKIQRACVFIIGGGPLYASLEQHIRDAGVEQRVRLLGQVDETYKQRILISSDAYISAAHHEGFGIVFLEAMEAGLPIIATTVGGHLDFLKSNRNAFLVSSRNPSVLAKMITRLMNDRNAQHAMREHNRQDVKKYYIQHAAEAFERVLASVHDIRH